MGICLRGKVFDLGTDTGICLTFSVPPYSAHLKRAGF